MFPQTHFQHPRRGQAARGNAGNIHRDDFRAAFEGIGEMQHHIGNLLFRKFLLREHLRQGLADRTRNFRVLPHDPLQNGIVQAPLIQDGAAQRRGKMRQKHFIKIAVFKEIDFGILTDVLDQLLHLVRQTRIEAFVKKIIIQVTEEIAQQISEENDFADRIQLLRMGCDFSKNLLRQIQKFLVDLSRIGLFHQLAASRDAIHGNRQHQNQKLQLPITQVGKAGLDDFPH